MGAVTKTGRPVAILDALVYRLEYIYIYIYRSLRLRSFGIGDHHTSFHGYGFCEDLQLSGKSSLDEFSDGAVGTSK